MSRSICNFAEKLAPQPCHFSFDAVFYPTQHQGYLTYGFALFAPFSGSPHRFAAYSQWNVAYVLIGLSNVRPFYIWIQDSVAFCPAVSPELLSMHTAWLCNTDGSLVKERTVGAFVYEDILCYCCLRTRGSQKVRFPVEDILCYCCLRTRGSQKVRFPILLPPNNFT